MPNTILQDPRSWQGILPIVCVPFKRDESIDYRGFNQTLDYINKRSCFGLVLFGIASEFYKLSDYEKTTLVKDFVAFKTSKKKIISITDHSSHLAVERAKKYEQLGLDGLMVLAPFFLSPPKKEIISHIKKILEAVKIPVIVQIAPTETNIQYSTNELIQLHRQYPHVVFKIEGSPLPRALIKSLISEASDISIFNGYAGLYMPEILELGARGIMPGCSFIELYTKIYDLLQSNKKTEALDLHNHLASYLKKWMDDCEYIIKVEKNILKQRQVIAEDTCRSPSYNLLEEDTRDIQIFLEFLSRV